MLQRVLYVVAGISTLKNYQIIFHLIVWIYCLIAQIDHIVFMHSSVHGRLGYSLAIMMNAVNCCIQVFAWTIFSFLFGIYQEWNFWVVR